MAYIYKLTNAGGFKTLTRYADMLAGNTTWNPYDPSAYEPITAITIPSVGVASVTLNSIPQTYAHLQIRYISRTDVAGTGAGRGALRFNNDTAGNYTFHGLYGDGASAAAESSVGNTFLNVAEALFDGEPANTFAPAIVDVFDYTNTNKYKTTRSLFGYDSNGSGFIGFYSGLWSSTAAITSITLIARSTGTPLFKQYSSIALYGIKG
jgi:hypothetical protein